LIAKSTPLIKGSAVNTVALFNITKFSQQRTATYILFKILDIPRLYVKAKVKANAKEALFWLNFE
jgi:hypothetical protein